MIKEILVSVIICFLCLMAVGAGAAGEEKEKDSYFWGGVVIALMACGLLFIQIFAISIRSNDFYLKFELVFYLKFEFF